MPSHIVRLGNRVAWFLPDPGDRLWRCFLGGSIRWMLIFADGKSPAPAVDIVNVRRYNKLEYIIYWIKYNFIKVNILPHPQNCSVLTCSNHTKLVFNGSFVPGEGLFQGVGSPQGPVASGPSAHPAPWDDHREFLTGNFARRTSLTTTWILRPRRSTVLAEHDSQVPQMWRNEGRFPMWVFLCGFFPRMINDEFFKMIQDQMWQFVEICHMTFLSNYSVLSETVQRICFHTSLASCFQDLAALPWK